MRAAQGCRRSLTDDTDLRTATPQRGSQEAPIDSRPTEGPPEAVQRTGEVPSSGANGGWFPQLLLVMTPPY